MKLTSIQEEYLKTIYMLENKNEKARVTDIAKKLNKTKPTVNYAINVLKEDGLVEYETYGNITLTEKGNNIAYKILEAYDIIYLFLNEILNLDSESSEKEATKMKTILDDETLNKLAKYTHKTLGLHSLECGYDINNIKCIQCERRKNVNK